MGRSTLRPYVVIFAGYAGENHYLDRERQAATGYSKAQNMPPRNSYNDTSWIITGGA